jgi:hypothetical protein
VAGENYMLANLRIRHFAKGISLLLGLFMISGDHGLGQRSNVETIDAQAFGTSTQLGRNFGIKIIIYEFSSRMDRDRRRGRSGARHRVVSGVRVFIQTGLPGLIVTGILGLKFLGK